MTGNQTGSVEINIMYTTYDSFEIFPIMRLKVFISSCQIFSIGRCEPGECTQLSLVCHGLGWWTEVFPLAVTLLNKKKA